MDFEDEQDFGDGESSSRASSSAHSSRASETRVSVVRRNGVSTAGRLIRRRPPPSNTSKYSQSDEEDFSAGSSPSLVVRGAGASSWAVQDAGTVQMLNDECAYLCSALVSARSSSQALETALELAQLLASKKSRSVLWQSCAQSSATSSDVPMNSPLSAAAGSTTTSQSNESSSKPRTKTVLDAILDVIACLANGASGSKSGKSATNTYSSSNNSLASNSTGISAPGSPSRGARTKSARRRLKQQQLIAPQDSSQLPLSGITPSWWSQNKSGLGHIPPELAQTLAIITYYLSLDCTLSKEYSVAAMGAAPKPGSALSIRNIILQHGRALQGMVQLCLQDETKGKIKGKSNRIPSSVPSSGMSSKQRRVRGPNDESSSGAADSISTASAGRLNGTAQRQRRRQDSQQSKVASSVASSPAEDSLSSLSFAGENLATSITPKASGGGDPTKAGRQNRRRRRLLQSDSSMLKRKLPAVPEGNNDIEELYWEGGDKILPPPNKRSRKQKNGNSATTNLSFTSHEASPAASKESALFSEPLSPTRKETISSRTPLSPDDRSVASSVASLDSAGSFVAVRLAQKLQQLRSKVHLSSLSGGDSASWVHDDCDVTSQQRVDPWVSLVCLESLNRIITGKEGDGQSCLAADEQHDDEESPEDEESNPLLKTNRQLGKSGIIPCLSKCLSQELKAAPIFSEGGIVCSTCGQYWKERISVLASLIDGACLFNKDNRRSFAEDHDPFSFEEDPLHNNKSQGLVYHSLWFLHNSTPSEMSRLGRRSSENDTNVTGVRLLALRTLTSLTHDNELAAQQMTSCHTFGDQGCSIDFVDDDEDAESTSSSSVRGIDVLAKLVYELESEPIRSTEKVAGSATVGKNRGDEELHRYDSTIFCLNTLANIIEGSDVRRLLAEITVSTASSQHELWIQWLCKWLVHQTEGFREAILSIGKQEAGSQESERELEKNEEEKLLAAGNGCVLLACLMMEPDEIPESPESTNSIRTLIMEQMPLDKDGKSTGVTMLINTLKAFCNFYHFSLGELSLAIVGPVKKLIDGLQELK